jgi:hypothetical protein
MPYRVSFDTDGGALIGESVKDVAFGNVLGELPTAQKEGYEFFGWEYDGEIVNSSTIYQIPMDVEFKAVYKAKYTVRFSLTTTIANKAIECRLVKWGGVTNDGTTEFTDVVLELVEGQSLYSKYGFEVMPIVDPIEPQGENEYVFGNAWLWIDENGLAHKVNQGTIFSSENLNGITGGSQIVLIPYCKLTWTPRY